MHNLIGALVALLVFILLVALFGLVWLAGTIGGRITRLFS